MTTGAAADVGRCEAAGVGFGVVVAHCVESMFVWLMMKVMADIKCRPAI